MTQMPQEKYATVTIVTQVCSRRTDGGKEQHDNDI